jgi:hypothetical protein
MALNDMLAAITVLRSFDYDSFGYLSRIQPIRADSPESVE